MRGAGTADTVLTLLPGTADTVLTLLPGTAHPTPTVPVLSLTQVLGSKPKWKTLQNHRMLITVPYDGTGYLKKKKWLKPVVQKLWGIQKKLRPLLWLS